MKTLLSILFLVAISFGNGEGEKAETSTSKVIAYESFATPAAFGFGHNYTLDADKDGKADFLFTTVFETENGDIHTKYMVNAIGDNEVLVIDNEAAIADEGIALDSFGNISWKNSPASILEQVAVKDGNEWKGLWSGDRDQYIGIKLVKEGKSYTGWVKVFIDQATSEAQVQGYAINRVADNAINAGEI